MIVTASRALPVVLELFTEILGVTDIEPDESFVDLGGDSLLAARLIARLHDELPVELVTRTLFEAPTAAELAALLDERASLGSDR